MFKLLTFEFSIMHFGNLIFLWDSNNYIEIIIAMGIAKAYGWENVFIAVRGRNQPDPTYYLCEYPEIKGFPLKYPTEKPHTQMHVIVNIINMLGCDDLD